MSEFRHLDTKGPAEMGAVVEAIVRLRTFSERQLLDLMSDGKLGEFFPFHPTDQPFPSDAVAEERLQEASALPLSRDGRAALIQSSVPASANSIAQRDRLADALAWQERTSLAND